MPKRLTYALGAIGVLLIAAQFVPINRTNPPVETDIVTSPEIKATLKRACYDCHSHETVWPWYSRVAPVSFLVARDVRDGRRHLNFSTWNRYDATRQTKLMKEVWEQVDKGEMPMSIYLPMHPNARLSEADKQAIHAWTAAYVPAN